ncbi:hypothetical protein HJFPF1_04025 [Paramyrothecium foliicola]|nr:hypothetical protein HJFPF1_04025 [Paramyrothecium foliicola]
MMSLKPRPEMATTLIADAIPITATTESHVMGRALDQYVTPKVHPDLKNESLQSLRHIRVTGAIRRHPPARIASSERHRPLDFRRPTTTWIDPSRVQLNCFPSQTLVLHYASLLGTYLALRGRDPEIVSVDLPEPGQTARFLLETNLSSIGKADVAIIGDVDYLGGICDGPWNGSGESEHDLFRWKKFTSPKGKVIALVGCVEKIWGEAGEHMIRTISAHSGTTCIIYVAKAGCLSEGYTSNEWIATGDHAYLGEELVTWENPLDAVLSLSNRVVHGAIVTVPTLLCETHEWLRKWSPQTLWVDCEVAYMAKSAVELGIGFGFLHIVSDNLRHMGAEDLTNEESDTVMKKRQKLYEEITRILIALISQ